MAFELEKSRRFAKRAWRPAPGLFWPPAVFGLASLSFACLLGQFYNLWTMHWFGCWVLPPAIAVLALIAWLHRDDCKSLRGPSGWIVWGTIGGVLAAFAYDLYRLPFVLEGAPLFKVFPRFGEMLLGRTQPRWLVEALGWAYHFSNGAALGIMFLAMLSYFRRPRFLWAGMGWALFVETALLCSRYASFFGLQLNSQFLFLTASAHLIFGATLGSYCRRKLAPAPALTPAH